MATEEAIAALKESNVEILNFKHGDCKGKMKLHDSKYTKSRSEKETNQSTCVGDSSFMLKYRSDSNACSRIAKEVMAKWGSSMHAGSADEKYKN